MKKLFILVMLAFMLCPCTTWAQDNYGQSLSTVVTRGGHSHAGVTFTDWTSSNSLPTSPGSYCLTQDVTLSSTWEVPAGVVNLCLGGHVIKTNGQRVIHVPSSATLNLYDYDNYTTPHAGYVDNRGLWHLGSSGTGESITIKGGIITGGYTDRGGGIDVEGKFNMHGGNIAGCGGSSWGGGVYTRGGTSTISGGCVQYCAARYGGGVFVNFDSKCVMSGGSIEHCYGYDHSGGLLVSEGSIFTLEGEGKIWGNVSGGAGSVLAELRGIFIMTGGSITGNDPGLYNATNSKLNIFGGVITGNNGEGIKGDSADEFLKVGGTAQITGNVVDGTLNSEGLYIGGTPSNVNLPSSNYITIADGANAPREGMEVGVTITSNGGTGKFTTNGTENDVQYFFSDAADKSVKFVSNHLELISHTHGNWHYAASGNTVTATCGNSGCTTPQMTTTLTLNAPNSTYTGLKYNGANITTTAGFPIDPFTLTIMYEGVFPTEYSSNSIPPIDAGTYKASVTVGNSATAVVQFTISKANYEGVVITASYTLDASQGSTANVTLPDIPGGTTYGDVINDNPSFSVSSPVSTEGTVTLTTNAGGLPHNTDPMTFTVTVNPDSNHNSYDITVTVTPHPSEINGVYYFYNTAADKWLGVDNLNNGMKASLVDRPQPINVEDKGDYAYWLDAYIASSENANGYFGKNGDYYFMNCAEGTAVSFWPVGGEANAYIIKDAEGQVFGCDGNGTLLSAGVTEENARWTLFTMDDLIGDLTSATLSDPQDATFLISDPQCGKDNRLFNEWHCDGPTTLEFKKAGSDRNTHVSVGTPNGTVGKFNAYQDLGTDVPNGIYELRVQGFYSSTSDKRCAYFYANNETMALKDVASTWPKPATEEAASAAFTEDKYQCSTLRFVVTNRKIRIGVKGVYGDCGWTAFDNFSLTYFGPIGQ